jgi:twitching motility two-component system response regulator PilH
MTKQRHIVIVDPDDENRARMATVIAEVAGRDGYSVALREASDGITAIETIEENLPDLIVAEVLLEGFSGLELLRKLRVGRKAEDVPTMLFVTHMNHETDRYWGLRNGADAYLMKPYENEQLAERVEKLLAKDRSGVGELLDEP